MPRDRPVTPVCPDNGHIAFEFPMRPGEVLRLISMTFGFPAMGDIVTVVHPGGQVMVLILDHQELITPSRRG